MKLKTLLLFIFFAQVVCAQDSLTNYFYGCTYCGAYAGKVDTIYNNETSHIYAKLFLTGDSTYYFEIGGVFSWCTSQTFTGKGKWLVNDGWLCFKPDTSANGLPSFSVIDYPLTPAFEPDDAALKERTKHQKNGYSAVLKVPSGKDSCPRIYFRIAYDCFKGLWSNKYVEKRNCK